MFSEMMRRLRRINDDIERSQNSIGFWRSRKRHFERDNTIYANEIDRIASGKNDDATRRYINVYASRIESNENAINRCNCRIREYKERIDSLEIEKQELLQEIRSYEGLETSRTLDEFDYQLIIENTGYIHGTKL